MTLDKGCHQSRLPDRRYGATMWGGGVQTEVYFAVDYDGAQLLLCGWVRVEVQLATLWIVGRLIRPACLEPAE